MGFWDAVGNGLKKANEYAERKTNDFNDSYDKYSERYENMSNESLKREYDRLRNSSGGDSYKRMGQLKAMKDEIERRRR